MIQKRRYLLLQKATTKPEFAKLLGISPSFLTRILYKPGTDTHYHQFEIAKRSGGVRNISAPSKELKEIQRALSDLLLDCKDVIYLENNIKCTLSHGFERDKSIITNAKIHRNKKNVLNLDLENFFDSFNFGRVRGFFIANRNFQLDPHIATVIAQIACHNNSLPQGSPCSPTIANLITNSLDIKLAKLAKRNGCSYTRYADDITFSTRRKEFSKAIISNTDNLKLSSNLTKEIKRSGFSINDNKTRLLFKDSRQEATGLVINKKVNVKSEYWRTTRAMAHNLFKKGYFEIEFNDEEKRNGSFSELEGRLTFIDSIDHYNNIHNESRPKSKYQSIKHTGLFHFRDKLNSREKVYSQFLYYKYFHGNEFPTILTEGKTDNVYLKSALNRLQSKYAILVQKNAKNKQYEPKLNFPNLNKKTLYFLDLEGGASHFKRFIERYSTEYKTYEKHAPKSPVILILDNDTGPNDLLNHLANNVKNCPNTVDEIRKTKFLHIFHNVYLILTPLKKNEEFSMMEDLFYKSTLNTKIDNKTFSLDKNIDTDKNYGKHIFSTKVIRSNKEKINFNKFKPIFNSILEVQKHYSKFKKTKPN